MIFEHLTGFAIAAMLNATPAGEGASPTRPAATAFISDSAHFGSDPRIFMISDSDDKPSRVFILRKSADLDI